MQSSMLSTKQFIRQKCIKDHFKSKLHDNFKHSSVYTSDYKQKLKDLKPTGWSIQIAKQINEERLQACNNVSPFISVYRRSFQNTSIPSRDVNQPKQNYFMKTESCEPPQSFYDFQNKNMLRSLALNENNSVFKLQKGKAQIDNLIIPKYNKMTTKSLYTDSYENFSKLPSLYKENKKLLKCNQKDQNNVRNIKKIRF